MNQPINLKPAILAVRNSIRPAIAGRAFLRVALTLTWFAVSPTGRAQKGAVSDGTSTVASVSTTLPPDVNVARPGTGATGGSETGGVVAIKISSQEPASDGGFAAWAARG